MIIIKIIIEQMQYESISYNFSLGIDDVIIDAF